MSFLRELFDPKESKEPKSETDILYSISPVKGEALGHSAALNWNTKCKLISIQGLVSSIRKRANNSQYVIIPVWQYTYRADAKIVIVNLQGEIVSSVGKEFTNDPSVNTMASQAAQYLATFREIDVRSIIDIREAEKIAKNEGAILNLDAYPGLNFKLITYKSEIVWNLAYSINNRAFVVDAIEGKLLYVS
jgi:hypothetical protein